MTSEVSAVHADASPVAALERPRVRHIAELDGVRGVAILGVMLLHFVGSINAQSSLERLSAKLSTYGVWGVDLFFVLSGFLITGILQDAKGAPHYFRNFYARRTLRIFPLYYAVLLVIALTPAALVAPAFARLGQTQHVQGYLWTYLTNFYVASSGGFSIPYVSHFWSLAVEEHFYLVWPFLVGSLSLVSSKRACVVLAAVALTLRIALSFSSTDEMRALVWTPCRLDALCTGAWFALALRAPGQKAQVERLARKLTPLLAVLVLALSTWHARVGYGDALVLPLRGSALAVLFGAFIASVTEEGKPSATKRALRSSWLRVLGKYSYGLYVFHGIVAYSSHEHHWEERWTTALGSHAAAVALVVVAGCGLSFAIAFTSFELFERPVLKLKRIFEYRDRSAALPIRESDQVHRAKI